MPPLPQQASVVACGGPVSHQAAEAPGHLVDRLAVADPAAEPAFGRLGEDGAADGEAAHPGTPLRRREISRALRIRSPPAPQQNGIATRWGSRVRTVRTFE